MKIAYDEAVSGMLANDGGPFGAVIVKDDTVIAQAHNMVLTSNDPTAHAEIVAIRSACANLDNYWLEDCRMFVNCEPCPMCLGAIYWARIHSLTFAADRNDAANLDFDDAHIYREICRPAMERQIEIRQDLREEALRVMQMWSEIELKKEY